MFKPKKVEVIGVPLDLGANIRGANMGPFAIRIAELKRKIMDLDLTVEDLGDLAVPVREAISKEVRDQKYLPVIQKICEELGTMVQRSLAKDSFPLIIGGDHSLAIGSISGASVFQKRQNQELGVIWVDAHADINNSTSSPSGNIHGMPLAVLLGDGDERLVNLLAPGAKLKPQNVALVGIRNIDGKEKELVKQSGVNYFTMRTIDERGMYQVMKEAIEAVSKNSSALHVSFDIDGIDPLYAPGVSTPVTGGLSYREAHLALEMVADTGRLLSAEFVEVNPTQDQAHATANLTVELIQSALGKSIV